MFRLRSKSGDESVFRTPEEIRAALLSGFVTPDAQIWDAVLKGWVPLLEHSLYQQISAVPPGRKSAAVKAPPTPGKTPAEPPASPTTAKPVQKLVIRRPGEGAPTPTPSAVPPHPAPPPAKPVAPVAAKPPAPPPPKDETPELVMLDVDLSLDAEPEVPPTPAPRMPSAPPKQPHPTPTAAPTPPAPPPRTTPPPAPRVSAPRPVAAEPEVGARPAMQSMESMGSGGSKKGLVVGFIVVLLAAGGGFFALRGRGTPAPAVDSLPVTPRVAVVDSASDSVAIPAPVDTVKPDSVVTAAPDTTPVAAPAGLPAGTATAETLPAVPAVPPVPFAPAVERGATAWNARPVTATPLSIPELETVRLRYVASQSRALEQFEAGLGASGFTDMFSPAKLGSQDRRSEALDAIDGARAALNDFRRRQAAIDFAYRDTLKAALPAGSDEPDLRTFGPVLRETPTQAALTDSVVAELAEVYGTLVRESGSYTLRGRDLFFKQQATADRYRTQQERLTAQLGRIRSRPVTDVPPAMAAVLRGIGLPR